jgi:hypothetical protein
MAFERTFLLVRASRRGWAHPRFCLHFTPTGSSWINRVERWFGFLVDQVIRQDRHKTVAVLENVVENVGVNVGRGDVAVRTPLDVLAASRVSYTVR